MAQYNGYRYVPHDSYNAWRAAVLGNGYNVDYSFGNQCWDLVALLYWQYGLTLITRPGGNGVAADCWNRSRQANSRPPFISLTGKENIRRGDILVWNTSSQSATGHIAFADMDYSQRNSQGKIQILGQGQGSNVTNIVWSGINIIGIFRNTKWDSTPSPEPTPTPTTTTKRDNFPWPVAWKHWSNFKRK